jgi:hypothetical protein
MGCSRLGGDRGRTAAAADLLVWLLVVVVVVVGMFSPLLA